MKVIDNPPRSTWKTLCERPSLDLDNLDSTVRNILNRVKTSGDDALLTFAHQLDKVELKSLKVAPAEISEAVKQVPEKLKEAIRTAKQTIGKFHMAQRQDILKVETLPGVVCWRKSVPIEKVGLYVPGGTAPLFSTLLMLVVPATIAGCKEIIICTPPGSNGKIDPAILFTAAELGLENIFKAGGAQAIGAMAYGTQSIAPVYKIFGPGNQYVTKAKQMVSTEGIAIDMPAGPSEVMVVADEGANAEYIAADLLSQAEHGADSQVVLVSTTAQMIEKVQVEINNQLSLMPRQAIAKQALQHSLLITLTDENTILDFVNAYAPEHLILHNQQCEAMAQKVINAGSVFLGPYSPESVGDYASGTNHTLPTAGFAKAYSGISLESFQKYITFQQITQQGLGRIGPVVETMAEAENLWGHQYAVTCRLKDIRL